MARAPTRLASALAAGVLLVGVAACASPAIPASSHSQSAGNGSATAVAETLAASGLPCTELSSRGGATNVAEEVRCSIGVDDVIIRTFLTTEDRDRYLEASGNFVDQLNLEVDAPPRLVGPTWIVTTDTRATAEKISAILGGELR